MDNLSARIVELDQNVYVIPGNTNVGVILSDDADTTQVTLIDSGASEIDGEYILDVLDAFFEQNNAKYQISGIISTHAHADHIGGHNSIKKRFNCRIYASKPEQSCMETPINQSATLWGGYPPHELRTLYFNPEPTTVDVIVSGDQVISLSDNRTISFIELHGHSHCGLGVIINLSNNKKIVFSGDAIFPKGEIGKYWIPLILNPVEFMDSLDRLCKLENVEWCIPSHGDFLKRNIEETAELNKIAIISTRMCILESLKDYKCHTLEEIIKYVADKNNLNMTTGQYALISSTVRSYIAVMHDAKEVKMEVQNNKLVFFISKK